MNGSADSPGTRRTRHARVAGVASALLITAATGLATPQLAAQPADLPAAIGMHVPGARLAGAGLLRWYGLRVYEARLWTGARRAGPDAIMRSSFALELRYARALAGTAIAAASRDEIARLGLGSPVQRAGWFAAMAGLFPDVVAGDRLTGVHLPGQGVVFYRNDRPLGRIEDPEFGLAFFSIWLHPDTSAPELRSALLGRDDTRNAEDR